MNAENEFPWAGMELAEEIGSGSFGTVFRVFLDGTGYALKRIRLPHDQEDAVPDLMDEIHILGKFRDHPNIVSIKDSRVVKTDQGYEIFILMEYLEPLPSYEVHHALSEQDVIRLGIDICSALESLQKESVLHRDLKPANILVTEEGSFKLCDFGAARELEATLFSHSVKGSFSFMAPEVYHGKRYDHRADVYSLGMILYRSMNRGREPFIEPGLRMISYKEREAALNRRMKGEALPMPPDASEDLAQILLKACAYSPEKRYSSASDLKADLVRLRDGSGIKKKAGGRKFAKRTVRDYIIPGILGILMLTCAWKGLSYLYREYLVNDCDTKIRKLLEEEYGCSLHARLNGNGVLYISSNEDLYCTKSGAEYPWMNRKDRIRKLVFGENVTEMSAFYMDGGLGDESDNMPVCVNSFRDCVNLREIVIESGSFRMEGEALFRGDGALEEIKCSPDADVELSGQVFTDTPWIAADGFRMIGNTLVRYNGVEEILDDIPRQIVRIGTGAFLENEYLTDVTLPEAVLSVGDTAFMGCSRLEHISCPEALRRIGGNTFEGCVSLKDIMLPAELKEIGDGAFQGCISLKNIVIPPAAEEIESNVFRGCTGLTDLDVHPDNSFFRVEEGILYNFDMTDLIWCSPVVSGTFAIPDQVRMIESYAFADCPRLERLKIPDSVTEAGNDLFGSNPDLVRIDIGGANPFWVMEEGLLYTKDKTQLVFCERDMSGTVIVEDGTNAILHNAFEACKGLTQITLPDSAAFIFDHAFKDCSALTQIRLPGSLRFLSNGLFSGCTGLEDLYYAGSEEEWDRLTEHMDLGIKKDTTVLHFAEQ